MGLKEKMEEFLTQPHILKAALLPGIAILGLGKFIIEERREYRIVNGKTQYRDFVTTSDESRNNLEYTYSSWRDY